MANLSRLSAVERLHYLRNRAHLSALVTPEQTAAILAASDILRDAGLTAWADEYGRVVIKTRDDARATVATLLTL